MTEFKNFALLPIFLSLLVASIVVLATPHFADVFRSFDVELPAITRLLLASYRGWLILPVFAILSIQFTRKGTQFRANAVLANIILSAFAISLFAYAVYSPIFAAGGTTS